jgi:nicotinate-nucleotide pyrophosphorylase (carboxylating)
MTPETVAALEAAGLEPPGVERVVRAAIEEDFRYGPDVTSASTVGDVATVTGEVVARQPGVLAGVPVALAVLDLLSEGRPSFGGPSGAGADIPVGATAGNGPGEANETAPGNRITGTALLADGARIGRGDAVLRVSGPATAVLGAERTMLNVLTHLSGIATATRAWADAIEGTGAVVRDTRKTLPGLRALQKYAVRRGGGQNHRMGLGDAALIKDNHVAAAGGITKAIEAVRTAAPDVPLEVEVDTLDQLREALDAGARFILLDNMDVVTTRQAVTEARRYDGVKLESSGGLTLDNAGAVAATGVDYLAVGALTHSSRVLDLGLDFT